MPPLEQAEKKPAPKPAAPSEERLRQARTKAMGSGLLALRDTLSELVATADTVRPEAPAISRGGSQSAASDGETLKRQALDGSGGVGAAGKEAVGQTRLARREQTRVASAEAALAAEATARRGRSSEEIQAVFDRNKGAIHVLYNRALCRDPGLQGRLELALTIDPAGKVVAIELLSSKLGAPALERKILQRIKLFDFGVKAVATVTVNYPIEFFPR